ncbi:MAG: hypothetical protein CBB81_06340 [Cellvibrionales bacterium TMED21]|jgi:hypothetical protein|nr:hypothetical protein [Halieaceae bacterium]OUT65494.1 MAG: hypothetical protein CBB81_06340 [Cellvibrionales bacterium TMED21]|tara:strand:- start:13 stop:372 length:360 start_codon:yes stop_codon:yes gene_type:complete
MSEVERLEVEFKEALNARDRETLLNVHLKAIGMVSQPEKPPVIAPNKKAYERLIHAYICHVASSDSGLPYRVWWRAYYGDKQLPKKPKHNVERSRSHLREMKKHSEFTAALCRKYKIAN